jgi:hypothetical protein
MTGMKRALGLILLMLAACTPAAPVSGAEAVVQTIYKPLVDSKGEKGMPLEEMPLTSELKALVARAEEAGKGEPVFDGDFAGNCQDCTGFADLKLALRKDTGLADGRAGVEATFKLFQNEPKSVTWDMIETPEGWRVDNILSEGIDLRKISQDAIDQAAAAPDPASDEAVECMSYLRLSSDSASKAKPPGDAKALEAAYDAWRKKAETDFTADELAQYFASSVAVFDDTPADQLKVKTDACLAKTPQ